MSFDAVLFDCDGVLVDSEGITNGVLRDMLEERGWKLSPQECMRIFLGKAVKDERALIEQHTGQPLTEEWFVRFRERRNEGLLAGVQPIRHGYNTMYVTSGLGVSVFPLRFNTRPEWVLVTVKGQ